MSKKDADSKIDCSPFLSGTWDPTGGGARWPAFLGDSDWIDLHANTGDPLQDALTGWVTP